MPAQSENIIADFDETVWVFGYGSLIWKPNFKYNKVIVGYIQGVSRKFWQGSRDHRGTNEDPGRVATLIEDSCGMVHGLGFEITKAEADVTFKYLNDRETGYKLNDVTFFPMDPKEKKQKVLVYMATNDNPDFLGPAPLRDMANCITRCVGQSGPNCEYLFNLAHMMRLLFPAVYDKHLFDLEDEVKKIKRGYYTGLNEKR